MKTEAIRHCIRCYERLTDDENNFGYTARAELRALTQDIEKLEAGLEQATTNTLSVCEEIVALKQRVAELEAALMEVKGQADDLQAGLSCDEIESAVHVIQDTINEALARALVASDTPSDKEEPMMVAIGPEDFCQRCNRRMRFNYAATNECWNKVMRSPDGKEASEIYGIICIDCFIELCQTSNIEPRFTAFHIPGSDFYLNIDEEDCDEPTT
jgi:hypothetical protein